MLVVRMVRVCALYGLDQALCEVAHISLEAPFALKKPAALGFSREAISSSELCG